MNRVRRGLCLAIIAAASGCGGRAPASPITPSPTTNSGTTITGNERIAWTEIDEGADAFVYAVYVDGMRIELSDASCSPSGVAAVDCQALLPPMTNGMHTLELTATAQYGDEVLEGPKSAPFVVTMAGR
jgi:hypothetical protein